MVGSLVIGVKGESPIKNEILIPGQIIEGLNKNGKG